jgi:hypothetical protein
MNRVVVAGRTGVADERRQVDRALERRQLVADRARIEGSVWMDFALIAG